MATIGTAITIADVAKTVAPDGSMQEPVEMLAQDNQALEDIHWEPTNDTHSHRSTVMTGLPAISYRLANVGVPPTKAVTSQFTFTTARMESWVEIDEMLLDGFGEGAARYRAMQVNAHRMAQGQEFGSTLFYGNGTTAPEEFNGLTQYYNSLSAANGQNILSGGGSGSDNMSVWLIRWSPTGIFGLYPKGTKVGIEHNDLGKQTIESTAGVGGNRLMGYRDQIVWRVGVAVTNWTHAVRIANIDSSNLVAESSAANLPKLMSRAIDRIGGSGGRLAFYAPRTVASFLRVQGLNTSSSAVAVQPALDQFGKQIEGGQLTFLGIPVRRMDALLATEATVS